MLKKILFGFAAMLSFAACTGDYTDWAEPQHNDQPATVTFGNGRVEEVAAIDLATLAEGQEYVKVCNITAPTASAEGFAPVYTISLGGEQYELTNDGQMKVADLTDYIQKNFGKAPEMRDVEAVVNMWIGNGAESVKTASSAPFIIKAQLNAPTIYPHLYLIGAPSEWNPTCTTLPFEHSDKNVYDDPIFTVVFPATEGEIWFAFADDLTVETNDWSNVFAAQEGNGENKVGEWGNLCRRNELTPEAGDGSFKVVVNGDAKFIKVTVNMLESTYMIEKLNFGQFLWVPGDTNGWNHANAGRIESPNFDGIYQGYIYVGGPFKFTSQADWSGTNYGWGADATSMSDDGGAGNLWLADEAAVYYVNVNLVTMTYSATKINNMNLVGDFNGWNAADDAQQMTWNADELCFVKENAGVNTNGWKFTANNDWGINLGGTVDNLVGNGDNLGVAGKTIKLYPTRKNSEKIYCTVE